jgi:hypothetical protein
MYGGGMGELGVGRAQIELLAALFHADVPNDVAPSAYNLEDPPGGRPARCRRDQRRPASAGARRRAPPRPRSGALRGRKLARGSRRACNKFGFSDAASLDEAPCGRSCPR